MTSRTLLLLYGMSAWGAALNAPAWARLATRRYAEPSRRVWYRDVLLLVRVGLSLLSCGVAGLAAVRTYGDLTGVAPLSVPSAWGLVSIGLMALAEPMFLRVDELHAQSRGSRSWAWRMYWAGAVAWALWVGVGQ